MLHIFQYSLLPDRLLNPPLRLHIERVGVHSLDRGLSLYVTRPRLAQQLGEACRVVLRCMRNFRLCLWG
jgi:hypothetical protein